MLIVVKYTMETLNSLTKLYVKKKINSAIYGTSSWPNPIIEPILEIWSGEDAT